MSFVIGIIAVFLSVSDIGRIAEVNKLKKAAEQAYQNGHYEEAITSFRLLVDSLSVNEDPVLLNLANAYFQNKDTTNAANYYARLLSSDNDPIRSLAYQQMGIINRQQNKMDRALLDFKQALKSNPENEDARYNYELLKKLMKEQEQQQEDQIEPSENAKRLKAQADKLASQNLFEQALGIMQQGLQEDETVAAYNSFISKLNDVVESKQ